MKGLPNHSAVSHLLRFRKKEKKNRKVNVELIEYFVAPTTCWALAGCYEYQRKDENQTRSNTVLWLLLSRCEDGHHTKGVIALVDLSVRSVWRRRMNALNLE